MLAILTFLSTIFLGVTENTDTYNQTIVNRYIRADDTAVLMDVQQNMVYESGWQYEKNIGWVYLGDEITVHSNDA